MPENSISYFTKNFARPHSNAYLVGAGLLALTTMITVLIPQLAKDVINLLQQATTKLPQNISTLSLMIILLGTIQILVRTLSRMFIFFPARSIEAEIKSSFFAHLLQAPLSYYNQIHRGELLSRLSNDVGLLRAFYAFIVLQACNLTFLGSFALYQMLQVHWQLTLLCLSPLILMLIIARYSMTAFQSAEKHQQQDLAFLSQDLAEILGHVQVIQTCTAEESFFKRIQNKNQTLYHSTMRAIKLRSMIFPLGSLMSGISYLIVVAYGSSAIFKQELSIGDLLAFNIYIGLLSFPLMASGIIIAMYQRARVAADRLLSLHKIPTENSAPTNNQPPYLNPALLHIKDLNFKYKNQTVLHKLNLKLHKGQCVGLVGPIASGKSTLLQILSGLYKSPDNCIYINGYDLSNFNTQKIRQLCHLVLQEPYLFSSSIMNNLRFGIDKNLEEKHIFAACKKAQIYDEINQLDQKWDTLIGERGMRLSGGQKQRLALARAFLRQPEILLLDDINSALDEKIAATLMNAIKKDQQSILMASHRISSLKFCDYIYMLNKGEIIDQGNLHSLSKRHPDFFH